MSYPEWAPEVQLEETPVPEHEQFVFRVGNLPQNVDPDKPCWLRTEPADAERYAHVHVAEAPCNIKCPGWEE